MATPQRPITVEISDDGAHATLGLQGYLGILVAPELRDAARAVSDASHVRVDATDLRGLDTSALQILLALAAQCAARGAAFRLEGVNARVNDVLMYAGAKHLLSEPVLGVS